MHKISNVAALKQLVPLTSRPSSATGESPPTAACAVSPSGACRSVACARCTFTPPGVWACLPCVSALDTFVRVLPYHGDAPCHFCGASPLLTLRVSYAT